jgi:hypothetical protein
VTGTMADVRQKLLGRLREEMRARR